MKFMSTIFKAFVFSLILIGHVEIGYAQTASILPPAKTTFSDQNGKPLVSGTVDFYIPGTTTRKTTWKDAGQSVPNANPVLLDGSGRATILGDGSYRQVLKDRYGNIVWDGYTSSAGSGGGSGTTPTVGDGDAVGTIKPWAGFIAPYGYVFTYGQELVRTSYPEAFAALTSQQNVSCTSGSPTLTGVGSTSQLPLGSRIESSCLNAGATIVSKTTSTIVASSNAIISTTSTARFFPYGNGNGSSTFNVPDLRGMVLAGADNMGGIAANVLTSTYFGNSQDPASVGARGGNESHVQTLAELAQHSHTATTTNASSTFNLLYGGAKAVIDTTAFCCTTTAGSAIVGSAGTTNNPSVTIPASSLTLNTSISNQGSSVAFPLVQPTTTTNYIIKIIPDSNPNSFFGVASIGGMYGVINCGVGLTCAGNTISATVSANLHCTDINGAGTACTANTGSVGHAVPFLDGTNVFSGASNTFSNGIKVAGTPASFLGNPNSTSGPSTDVTIQNLPHKISPDVNNDYMLIWDNSTGDFKKITPGQINSSGIAGVTSVGGFVGALGVSNGISVSNNNISTTFTQNGSGTITTNLVNKIKQYNPTAQDYGAKCDGIVQPVVVSITAGSPILTATGAFFTTSDIGKLIVINGAGSAGNQLSSTISSFIDTTHVTIANNAITTVTGASTNITYGSDDTSALNLFLNNLGNSSGIGATTGSLSGICTFSSTLSMTNGTNDFAIIGQGQSTELRYAGTSTTNDLIIIGDGINTTSRWSISNLRITSAVKMTGGKALFLKKPSVYKLDSLILDQWDGGSYTLYDGIYIDHGNWGSIINSQLTSINSAITAFAGVELYLDNIQLVGIGSDTAIHVGGGFGGLYMGYVAVFGQAVGLRVDTNLDATGNNQFFISNLTAFDNNSAAAIYLDDSLSSNKSFTFQGWASSTKGSSQGAFVIVNFKNGPIVIGGGAQFLSNAQSAILYSDPTVPLTLGSDVTWQGNGGYGVNCTISTNIVFSDAKGVLSGNVAGDYSPNCHVEQLGATGYRKFANGYIKQWGTVAGNSIADTNVSFPIPFPNSVYSVTGNMLSVATGANVMESIGFSSPTVSGFTGYPRANTGSSVIRSGEPWNWEAWGR